jgi:eukaryotic-like serine/threonine-protein kinase
MSLTPGTRLGPYEVLAPLGAGGMGEVYRARDTRLDRTVAIKILPPHLATDRQFRERFEREARAISQLTHPHICTLYDVGEHERTAFLVMEHLEGETLADRLKKGALPIEQAVQYAIDVATALEAAHRHGVVHRDLKPGNVMVTKSGVKLLDFGLAKFGASAVASSAQPTEMQTAAPITAQGTILGTFQYMAPEQLEGAEADARADIWAFGCLLYEMIAGRPAFEGKTQLTLMSAILDREPAAISELQPKTPPALGRVARTCLAKHPDDRFQTAHDLRLQLRWIQEGGSAADSIVPSVARRRWRIPLLWAASLAIAAAVVTGAVIWQLEPAPPNRHVVTRFEYSLPEGQTLTRTERRVIALSADGTKLAYVANQQIYLRAMDRLDAEPIRGTTEDPAEPCFSPDGQWLAYFVSAERTGVGRHTLKKIPVTGGVPVSLADVAFGPVGAEWRTPGTIVFSSRSGNTFRVFAVPDGGGTPRTLVSTDASTERVMHPQLLPDGRHIVFALAPLSDPTAPPQIAVQPIDGGDRRVLISGGTDPHVLPKAICSTTRTERCAPSRSMRSD